MYLGHIIQEFSDNPSRLDGHNVWVDAKKTLKVGLAFLAIKRGDGKADCERRLYTGNEIIDMIDDLKSKDVL